MKKEEITFCGKLFYFDIINDNQKIQNYFSSPKQVNLNKNSIKEFKLQIASALAITKNNELIQWQNDHDSQNKNQKEINKEYLSKTPSYIFNKIKFKSISINSTMCLALDSNSKVMTWGKNSNGLLGLGHDITSIESPIYIEELKDINISQLALSENHAVALSSTGIAFSWGLGKYGELGQERTIYTPFPLQMSSDNLYSKVYCYNYVTCFLDLEGHFSYFGVIIRNLEINNLNLTTKSLLEDESMKDGKTLVHEVVIEEIENEKVIHVVIGNGFVGLLCENGYLFVLEYKDKLTKLYTKYYCYDIVRYNNDIYGFAKNESDDISINYYLCQWTVNYKTENLLSGDSWNSTFWKINGNSEINSKFKFIDIGNPYGNIDMIFILDMNETTDINNKISFEFDSEYDDSFNLRYKRSKSKNSTVLNDASLNAVNKSKQSFYKYLNKTYNNNSIGLNYNYSLYKPFTQIGLNKFKNKDYLKNKNNIINENINYKNSNKENIDINIEGQLNEYREKELNNYRKEIDIVINNFRKRKNMKNKSLIENDKKNDKFNLKNDDNILLIQNQGIFSKTLLSNSGINAKNNINIKNNNSKDYLNNNNSLYNKKNIGNYNNSQKESCTNIDDYFGKESSNIMKNDDIFSDLNEFSNTNFNYLCSNIDVSNKIYNGNNSNNLLINSDRTLNFSGNNYIHRKNKRNLSPRFINENDSINFNSIISAKIDKSNDFFSEYGKKQSRNNYNESNIIRKELNKNSKGSQVYKTKNLNIDIQESNIESNKQSDISNSYKNLIKDYKPIQQSKIKDLIKYFFPNGIKQIKKYKLNILTNSFNKDIESEISFYSDINNLRIVNSSPNLLALKKKEKKKIITKPNKVINIKKRKEITKEKITKNFDYDYGFNPFFGNDDFIQNEARKTGKFHFPKKEKDKIDSSKNSENNSKDDKKINLKYLSFFCFLVKLYMRKILFKTLIQYIINYKNYLAKKYATKMFYRIVKRRIIFYEIKFYRRLKKIRKFYIKYEQMKSLINERKNSKINKKNDDNII